jgi:NarL family two-component system sensor histidine kinase LiaS
MSSQKNLQRRLKSSTRVQLARDLHDSLAQDLVAIGYKVDLLTAKLPFRLRAEARDIRFLISESLNKVRREIFALRSIINPDYLSQLSDLAKPLKVHVVGELSELTPERKRIVDELVRNAAMHSKGRNIKIEISSNHLIVSDDGQGLFGISEFVAALNGKLSVKIKETGTEVEIELP